MDNSDTLSLKSCPVFRPSRRETKDETVFDKPKHASVSSLSDIRECLPARSVLRKHKDPPDKPLKEDVKALIESEWKKRTRPRNSNLSALQTLARKQQTVERTLGGAEQNISGELGLEALLRARFSNMSKNYANVTSTEGDGKYAKNRGMYDTSANAEPMGRNMSYLSSTSCTMFGEKQVARHLRQNNLMKTSKSVHDDVVQKFHVTETPALGVQELKRRFSVQTKTVNTSEENERKDISKLTQTSFTDVRSSGTHLPRTYAGEFRKQHPPGMAEGLQQSWNTTANGKGMTQTAEDSIQGKEQTNGLQTARLASAISSSSVIVDNASLSSKEMMASLTSYSKCHQHYTDVSQLFFSNIIPPPPEFDYEPPNAYLYECQCEEYHAYQFEPEFEFPDAYLCPPNSDEAITVKVKKPPPKTTKPEPRAKDPDVKNTRTKGQRLASAIEPSRTARDRYTQTTEGPKAGRRRYRRVTYSPSDLSSLSGKSEDRWSVETDRGTDCHRRLRRRRRGRCTRRTTQEPSRCKEPLPRTAGSRPVSGRSFNGAGSRPFSGRSCTVAEDISRPTLVDEVHRKVKNQKRVVAAKRRRSKRKVFQVPKNMPEAIARFLEQLSKDREAIKVIHKMSLVINKK